MLSLDFRNDLIYIDTNDQVLCFYFLSAVDYSTIDITIENYKKKLSYLWASTAFCWSVFGLHNQQCSNMKFEVKPNIVWIETS